MNLKDGMQKCNTFYREYESHSLLSRRLKFLVLCHYCISSQSFLHADTGARTHVNTHTPIYVHKHGRKYTFSYAHALYLLKSAENSKKNKQKIKFIINLLKLKI